MIICGDTGGTKTLMWDSKKKSLKSSEFALQKSKSKNVIIEKIIKKSFQG